MKGWVKLYRELKDKPIWKKSTPEHKAILITLLMMANHDKKEWEWQGEKFKVNPGQFITSIESIRNEAGKGITTQNVRSALKRFQNLGFLTNHSTKTGRLITIVNWDNYQSAEIVRQSAEIVRQGNSQNSTQSPTGKPTKGRGSTTPDGEGLANNEDDNTNKEVNRDTNKEPTKNQQRGNKEVTPNKNDKNDKNERMKEKSKYAPYVHMHEEEYNKLINRYGKNQTDTMIEMLDAYKGSKGKTYKDDYRAILSWVVKAYQEQKGGTSNGKQGGTPGEWQRQKEKPWYSL